MDRLTEKQSAGYDLKALKSEWCDYYCNMQDFHTCVNCGIYQAIQKLANYEDMEEQGKMMILPCNYGDFVWFIKSNFSYAEKPIKAKILYIAIRENGDFFFRTNVCGSGIDRTFSSSNIGKTVFLTETEAEKELEMIKNESGIN